MIPFLFIKGLKIEKSLKGGNFKKGFTLLEMLLYISGFSIMIFGISAFAGLFTDVRVKNQVIAEVEQQGANIVHQITQVIRDANAVISPAPGNNDSSLVLDFPGTLTLSLNGTVIQSEIGAIYEMNSSRVRASNLIFQNLSRPATPGAVRISFTLSHANPGGRSSYNYSQDFYITANIRPNYLFPN